MYYQSNPLFSPFASMKYSAGFLGDVMSKIAHHLLIENGPVILERHFRLGGVGYNTNENLFHPKSEDKPTKEGNKFLVLDPPIDFQMPERRTWILFYVNHTPFVFLNLKNGSVRILKYKEYVEFRKKWESSESNEYLVRDSVVVFLNEKYD